MTTSLHLQYFSTDDYTFLYHADGVLCRYKQISADTSAIIEKEDSGMTTLIIANTTDSNKISNGIYDDAYNIPAINNPNERKARLLCKIAEYLQSASGKDYKTIVKELREIENTLHFASHLHIS